MVPISCHISSNDVDYKVKKERKNLPDDDKVVQRRKRDREKQLRRRIRKHFEGVIAKLNGHTKFPPKRIA